MSENFEAEFIQPTSKDEQETLVSTEKNKIPPAVEGKRDEAVIEPNQEKTTDERQEENRYSPEAIRKDIRFKADKIRKWAKQAGFAEGKDFLIIESATDIETETESIAPHEFKQFFVGVHEDHYRQFTEYILGQYSDERRMENPNNKHGGPRLDYSWGGRYAVGWDGAPLDTVAISDFKNLTVPTHQAEFRSFFKRKAGFDFPTSESLNPILQEMSTKGLETYKLALEQLKNLREQKKLPDDGYGLIDAMEHAIMILEDAKSGEALIDLPELIRGKMPAKMRHYADLTYNIEDIKNLDRVVEITGISVPDEVRIDKIFDRFNFNRQQMENICRDFSSYIMAKRELRKFLPEK